MKDNWTDASEEFICEVCKSYKWSLVFLEGHNIYGDCGKCDAQQVLYEIVE